MINKIIKEGTSEVRRNAYAGSMDMTDVKVIRGTEKCEAIIRGWNGDERTGDGTRCGG